LSVCNKFGLQSGPVSQDVDNAHSCNFIEHDEKIPTSTIMETDSRPIGQMIRREISAQTLAPAWKYLIPLCNHKMNQIVTGFKGPNVLHIMGFIQFRISAWQRIELRNSGMKGRAWAFPGFPVIIFTWAFTWAFRSTWAFRTYPDFRPKFRAWPDEFTEVN
jgi:hypothetical protein